MSRTERSLPTPRLGLVPRGPDYAADRWLVHNDGAAVRWYDGWRPSRHGADQQARRIAESWRLHGVHKWMAYDRDTGEVVGRGGLSRTPIDDDWAQLYALLPNERRERWGGGGDVRDDAPFAVCVILEGSATADLLPVLLAVAAERGSDADLARIRIGR